MLALQRLATACGIEPFYWDIAGTRRETAPETAQAILAAMGHRADDEAAATRSLEDIEQARRARPWPAVVVAPHGEPAEVPLTTLAAVEWMLVEESGRARHGMRRPDQATAGLRLPGDVPTGYHRLELACAGAVGTMPLIVTPRRCHLPEGFDAGARPWGLAAHLYTLRSERHWGVGDLGDLRRLAAWAGSVGAATIGLHPLHALSPLHPGVGSPYFPSSRLFLNPIYLDIPALPEFARSAAARRIAAEDDFASALNELRKADLTDHARVAAHKQRVLEALYDDYRNHVSAAGQAAFAAFRSERGARLQAFATYEALAEQFRTPVWREWPEAYREPASPAVAQFAEAASARVGYRAYVQWLCARQLRETRDSVDTAGLALGLYGDLALGVDPNGADGWADQSVYSARAALGAPPDRFAPGGQNWGLAAPLPDAMRRTGYASFIATLRANMATSNILRIDHVMALQRAYWVPAGLSARAGAYVRYPAEDLIGIVALESQRSGTVVVGEDLGTVEPELRSRLAEADILSYRVLYFEQEQLGFRAPEAYSRRAVACVGTHDLPPLAGFWRGRDISARRRLSLYENAGVAELAERQRQGDRDGILRALRDAGLWSDEADAGDAGVLRQAVHRFLARTDAWLAMLQIDDLLGESDAINLAGTVDEHPNWCRKLRLTVETIVADADIRAELESFARERQG